MNVPWRGSRGIKEGKKRSPHAYIILATMTCAPRLVKHAMYARLAQGADDVSKSSRRRAGGKRVEFSGTLNAERGRSFIVGKAVDDDGEIRLRPRVAVRMSLSCATRNATAVTSVRIEVDARRHVTGLSDHAQWMRGSNTQP
jgi:hypothetical protein